MRKSLKALFVASAFVAGIAAAPTLYAHDSQASQGSTMGPGMMGGGGMMGWIVVFRAGRRRGFSMMDLACAMQPKF